MVLEKTLESPLDCKEIQPVHSEGDQPWDFFERNDAKVETSEIFFWSGESGGRGAGLGLHYGRWALVAMGQLTQVPCIGRWILNHWTRKSLKCLRLLCITLHHLAPLLFILFSFFFREEYI